MAMSMGSPGSGSGRGRRRRGALDSNINVTPFVDVVLVLLVIFMVTAPLLATGVDVTLPSAKASTLPGVNQEPLKVQVRADGSVWVQSEQVRIEELATKLTAIAQSGYDGVVYLELDTTIPTGAAVEVMARVQAAGLSRIAILTDPQAGLGPEGRP